METIFVMVGALFVLLFMVFMAVNVAALRSTSPRGSSREAGGGSDGSGGLTDSSSGGDSGGDSGGGSGGCE